MYSFLLHLHSWNRWLIIITGVLAIVTSFMGWQQKRSEFLKKDHIIAASFIGFLHLQLIIGLLLQFVYSPIAKAAMSDFGAAMKNTELRFWAVEHLIAMVLVVAIAQIGRIKSKKNSAPSKGYKQAFVFYLVSAIIMLASIPWGLIHPARPLFRF